MHLALAPMLWSEALGQETLSQFLRIQANSNIFLVTGSHFLGFPSGSAGKESTCNVGDLGLIPGSGRSPREGNSYPLQYSGLEKFHAPYRPWGRKEPDTTERLALSLGRRGLTVLIGSCKLHSHSFYCACACLSRNSFCYNQVSCVWSVAQSCPILCNPLDCSPPGSSIHGISQARILEWGAISFSRRPSRPRDWTWVSCISCIGRWTLYHWATGEAPVCC